jgi:toluene monooxygenase system protein E
MRAPGPARKTYSHLAGARRLPSAYEIGTTRLLYYVERGGFAVDLPTSDWYRRYQSGSPLRCAAPDAPAGASGPARPPVDPWAEFADPRATTYASYVAQQRGREAFVSCLLDAETLPAYDRALASSWVAILEAALPPLRFVAHGLQMVAAYLGQMAPTGRVTVAALFQTADQVRRIHGVARRMGQLGARGAGFGGAASRACWEGDASWQPLRRTVERLLVTYDWGEALVALNVCLQPLLDELFFAGLAALAERHGDYIDAQILRSYADDGRWHRAWTQRLLDLAGRAPDSREAIARWVAHWQPQALSAAEAAAASLGPEGPSLFEQARRTLAPFVDPFTREGRDAA